MNLSFLFSINKGRFFNLIFGLVFLAFFSIGFKAIDPMFYLDRDDGIISFSHIINFEKYGFLGVSPSGERIESFSTPIHILSFLVFRTLFGVDYHAYIILQSLLCGFFLGYILILFFEDKDNITKAFIAAISGALLVLSIRFFQWHCSGLENPLTSVFFLFFSYKLVRSSKGNVDFWSGLSFALASITRIESVFFTFPLIGIFWIFNRFGWRFFTHFILPGVLFLALVHGSRYIYFGDFFPNTAKGQNISIAQNVLDTILFNSDYWSSNLKMFYNNFRYNHGFLYLAGLGFLILYKRNNTGLILILVSFLILSFFHLFIFNATRLDSIRYASYLAPLGVLSALFLFTDAKSRLKPVVFYSAFIPAFFFLSFLAHKPIFQICCEDKIFLRWNEEMTTTRSEEGWQRPLVSNPDLGIISYRKEYNILDLGLIGSKLTANLQACSPMKRALFFEFARPEMIRVHANWSDLHKDLFKDTRFWQQYEVRWINKKPSGSIGDSTYDGFFVRKEALKSSGSIYRQNYDQLKSILVRGTLDGIPPQVLAGDPRNLGKILFEFLPELRANISEDQLQTKLKNICRSDFYTAWFTSAYNPGWFKQSQEAIFQSMLKSSPILDSAKGIPGFSCFETGTQIFVRSENRDLKAQLKVIWKGDIFEEEVPARNLIRFSNSYGFVFDKEFGGNRIYEIRILKEESQVFAKVFPVSSF